MASGDEQDADNFADVQSLESPQSPENLQCVNMHIRRTCSDPPFQLHGHRPSMREPITVIKDSTLGRLFSDDGRPMPAKAHGLHAGDENDYQGPHDWRKRLKPVNSPDRPSLLSRLYSRKKDSERRMSYEEHNKPRPTSALTRREFHAAGIRQRENRSNACPIDGQSACKRLPRTPCESDFTRQIVKQPSGILRPQLWVRKSSLVNGQPLASESCASSAVDIKKCIEKAQKARLYLLRQTGPNSFLIGGDSPDHKYRVIIGEQQCSCGRSPRCVHVFFVMLRVFQLSETDPKLFSRKLKNFEVETLLRNLNERRLNRKVKSSVKLPANTKTSNAGGVDTMAQPTSPVEHAAVENGKDEEDNEEEEEMCSICLLEMVEGESLTVCKNGCQNRLHHQCITRWFEECRQERKPLHCPLCQASWQMESSSLLNAVPTESLRAASPGPASPNRDVESMPLDPIPADCRDMADKWIPVLGDEIVVRLFSRSWAVREFGLRMMGQEAVTVLLRGVGEGRSGLQVSPARRADTRTMLECCFSALAYSLADPVYKVFVAGLRSLRLILLYTPCRDDDQQSRLQRLITPIVKSLLFKCADSNRRMSQLSIDALLEMVKGDDGELPVGREIVSPGALGLGGMDFLLQCILDPESDSSAVQWQWLLGRLYVLDRLLESYPDEFKASVRDSTSSSAESAGTATQIDSVTTPTESTPRAEYTVAPTEASVNYERTFSVLQFCARHMAFVHAKVAKMVHRVFYRLAAPQVTVGGLALVERFCCLLDNVDPQIRQHVRHRLQLVAGDYANTVATFGAGAAASGAESNVVFFMSAQSTSPLLSETVANSMVHEQSAIVSGSTLTNCDSTQADVVSFADVDELSVTGVPSMLVRRAASVGSRLVSMVDACVATSPSLKQRNRRRPSHLAIDIHGEGSDSDSDTTPQDDHRPRQLLRAFSTGHPVSDDMAQQNSAGLRVADQSPVPSGIGLTYDLSDFNLTPSSTDERVSFKKEVASTPHVTPPGSTDNSSVENCHCKEEVEKEEAQALAAAMERSSLNQEALPFVPGLSRETSETTLTIHVQDEGHENNDHIYREGVHWVRGPVIGTGAFSTCYQARDIHTGTLMTVKQISFCRNTTTEQDRVIEAVRREIDIMAKFNHPNIVRILGATQKGCHFFMFVEWMAGCSLAYLLDKYGGFSNHVVAKYTEQILRGLAYLHENQTLHRDLKGANILVDSTGHRVRIGDFGACARLASRMTGAGEFEGQLLGTIAFMAPEVLRGANYGRSCDIWSVGCVMLEMVTTKPPWGAHDVSNHYALIYQIASAVHPPEIPENIFPPIRDMMLRCLEVNPDDRPTAKELLKHPLFTMSKR